MNNEMPPIGAIIIYIYLLIAHVFTFYFWYQWAQNHSFLNSLFIGPIVAEFKGLLFPFFI